MEDTGIKVKKETILSLPKVSVLFSKSILK